MPSKLTGWSIACFCAALFNSSVQADEPTIPAKSNYHAGDVWTYKTRPADEGSTLTVLKVEKYKQAPQNIVQIRVSGVNVKCPSAPGGMLHEVKQMPLFEPTLATSTLKKIKENEPVTDLGGYASWKSQFQAGKPGLSVSTWQSA